MRQKSIMMVAAVMFLSVLAIIILPSNVFAQDAVLIHQYDFLGDLEDTMNSGTTLTIHPNTASSGFSDGEWWWTATSGPGGGLILETDLLTNPRNYSLGFRIRYNQVSPGWKKILSFKGPSVDNGLYFYNSYLQFYPFGSNTAITYNTNSFYDFIFTRSADDVMSVYVVQGDGSVTKVYERDDPSDATVPIQVNGKYQFMFFMDDVATSGEYTNGGTVRSIRVWNGIIEEESVGKALSDVITGEATDLTANSAVLHGSINPYGVETTVYFEYGLTADYGLTVEIDDNPVSTSMEITKTITELAHNTKYHYRLKAVNNNGVVYGEDKTFTTSYIPVSAVSLNYESLSLILGGHPALLEATIEPNESTDKSVLWTSSNEEVASVSEGNPVTVTPLSTGVTTVTVTTADGNYTASCIITVYPATVTVNYDAQGGDVIPQSQTKRFGSYYGRGENGTTEDSLPLPTMTGYTFAGWYTEAVGNGNLITNETEVTVDSEHTLYAKWIANTDTLYKVEHYHQDEDQSGYILKETELFGGTTGTATVATANSYVGYIYNEDVDGTMKSGTIAADGSLVLKLYYDRQAEVVYETNDSQTGIKLGNVADNILIGEKDDLDVEKVTITLKVDEITDDVTYEDQIKKAKEKLGEDGYILLNTFDIYLLKEITKHDGSVTESKVLNIDIIGMITVRIPVPEELLNKENLGVVFIDDNENVERLETKRVTIEGIDYLEFETDHFSIYAIVEEEETVIEDEAEEVDLGELPQTGGSPYLVLGLLALTAGIILERKKSR